MGILCCYCCCCFNNFTSKTLEIIQIVFQSICFFLLFLSLVIIKWSYISIANLLLFILMLIFTTLNIIFMSFIRYWRAKNLIKTTKKMRGQCFVSISFGITIACFVICIIEEFLIYFGFRNADYPCLNVNYENPEISSFYNYYYYSQKNRNLVNNADCYKEGPNYYANSISDIDYLIAYITFTCLEISFILGVWIWCILRKRIIEGLDGPAKLTQPVMYDQYGRQVVIVQQGDVVMMNGQPHVAAPAQNQNNNNISNNQFNQSNNQFNFSNSQVNQFNNNHFDNNKYNDNRGSLGSTQNISNQINNNPIPDSQEYNLQEKPH